MARRRIVLSYTFFRAQTTARRETRAVPAMARETFEPWNVT